MKIVRDGFDFELQTHESTCQGSDGKRYRHWYSTYFTWGLRWPWYSHLYYDDDIYVFDLGIISIYCMWAWEEVKD